MLGLLPPDECMVTAVIKSNGHGLALEVGGSSCCVCSVEEFGHELEEIVFAILHSASF